MENKAICAGCGEEYWPKQAWMHRGHIPAMVANKHGKYADAAARKNYMREYMRKRRAGK